MTDIDLYLTDEVVEKAALAAWPLTGGQDSRTEKARSALSAVLPDIIRQAKTEALRDAADELRRLDDGRTGGYYDAGRHIIRRLDARADRIEQGCQP